MISYGRELNRTLSEITSKISESEILYHYLDIKELPCVINSPLREDRTPSFGIYCNSAGHIYYKDFATKEHGNLFTLLKNIWGINYQQTLNKIYNDIIDNNFIIYSKVNNKTADKKKLRDPVALNVKVRDWENYDLEYWNSFGISLKLLKWAEVYPISHKFITKSNKTYIFCADKYSYVYVHHKDNITQLKIYSPFNKEGFKWSSNTDRSVWSLWDKLPDKGNNLIITSSLKDCLNIIGNLQIPAICLQGEGYTPKPHVVQQLRDRFKNIVVFYDNDYTSTKNNGRQDALILHKQFGFPIVEIPAYFEAKDPSDLYKKYGKDSYLNIMEFILKKKLYQYTFKNNNY